MGRVLSARQSDGFVSPGRAECPWLLSGTPTHADWEASRMSGIPNELTPSPPNLVPRRAKSDSLPETGIMILSQRCHSLRRIIS
jgi:hypothetical protein